MPNRKALPNGVLTKVKTNKMDEHLFLKGQRVISPEGEGEVVDAIGDQIVVKLDKGQTQTFPSDDLQDNNSAG
jgi:hypothetical protein